MSSSLPVFARHETFHPRYLWLKKGFDAAEEDPEAFIRSDAHVRLGVGKNMVRAIRYWCHAFKLLEEDHSVEGRATGSKPSEFGAWLLSSENGRDPFLEDLGSLWHLHWKLLSEPCEATGWWYTFFAHTNAEINPKELAADLRKYVDSDFPTARTADSSLKKDVNCLIRMYGVLPSGSDISEASIQCPFAELGLLRPAAEKKTYVFRMGPKPGLSAEIITAASLDFVSRKLETGVRTISLSRLVHEEGSPGLAFKLPESVLYAALEEVAENDSAITLSDTAGIVQLSFESDPSDLSQELLESHYERRTRVEVFV